MLDCEDFHHIASNDNHWDFSVYWGNKGWVSNNHWCAANIHVVYSWIVDKSSLQQNSNKRCEWSKIYALPFKLWVMSFVLRRRSKEVAVNKLWKPCQRVITCFVLPCLRVSLYISQHRCKKGPEIALETSWPFYQKYHTGKGEWRVSDNVLSNNVIYSNIKVEVFQHQIWQ